MKHAVYAFLTAVVAIATLMPGCNNSDEITFKEDYLQVEGGRIWYRIAGMDKSGTPLLVVHGGPGANHLYLMNLESLSLDRPVIFYDQSGCGNSTAISDTVMMTPQHYDGELKALMNALPYSHYFLLGQSWGGALVAQYLIDYRLAGVDAVIFSAPLLSTPRWEADQQYWLNQMPQDMQDAVNEAEATGNYQSREYLDAVDTYYARHLCRLNPWPDYLNESFNSLNATIYNYMWGNSEFSVSGSLKDFDLENQLSEITIPVLFTCGEFDEARPETCSFFADLMPGAQVFIMKGCAHMHHIEDESNYVRTVDSFLQNINRKK